MHTLYKNFRHKIVYRRHEWSKFPEIHEGNTVRENSFAWKMWWPIQERWAHLLHQEAGVPEGPCGFEELQKFQDYLGPQGYQLIVVEPSKCLIVFKDAQIIKPRISLVL